MRHVARTIAIIVAVMLAGCDGGSVGVGSGGEAVAFFDKPFDGDYPVGNFFDHDAPLASDNNGFVVDHTGARRAVGEPGAGSDGHDGYDWGMVEGTPIKAVATGEVVHAGDGAAAPCPLLPGSPVVAAKVVTVMHTAPNGDRYLSSAGHFSSISVAPGADVRAGDEIGISGNTGCSTAPHLHFEVHRWVDQRWVAVDPYGWTASGPDPWAQHPQGTASAALWKPGEAPTLVIP